MHLVRQTILVLRAVALAALWCSPLHGAESATESHTPASYEKTLPPLLDSGGKQRCATYANWCPDDHCPKCPPCISPPSYCGGCDCYDVKCPPCICPPRYCGSCDCYDVKCAPCVKIPWCFPGFYKCPLPACYGPTVGKTSKGK